MTVFKRIIDWNDERKLLTEFNKTNEISMLREELHELINADSIDDHIDALCDLIVVATGGIRKLGYSPELCMNECLKEIESRVGSIDRNGKFQKDKSPEAMANWYKADYSKCKS